MEIRYEEAIFGRTDHPDSGQSSRTRRTDIGPQIWGLGIGVYVWRRRYEGMDVSQLGELKPLQQKNAQLKKLMAKRNLEPDDLARQPWTPPYATRWPSNSHGLR